jgi:hypothetical protein
MARPYQQQVPMREASIMRPRDVQSACGPLEGEEGGERLFPPYAEASLASIQKSLYVIRGHLYTVANSAGWIDLLPGEQVVDHDRFDAPGRLSDRLVSAAKEAHNLDVLASEIARRL